ncbi:hypothetical protein IJ670_05005 [bacterium]|nr:hypothetical protein [bacterium]
MKNTVILLILSVMLFNCANAIEKTKIASNYPYWNSNQNSMMPSGYATRYISPWGQGYFAPWSRYDTWGADPLLLRMADKLKNVALKLKNPNNGAITGYSVPVNQGSNNNNDLYDPNDTKQRLNSPTCSMDLFSTPQMNGNYSTNKTQKLNAGKGATGKTGATVIWD